MTDDTQKNRGQEQGQSGSQQHEQQSDRQKNQLDPGKKNPGQGGTHNEDEDKANREQGGQRRAS